MIKSKTAKETLTIMTELVLPNETNNLGNMMGGRLMYWMDICSAIAAQKFCNKQTVTASVDNISFRHPIKLANVVTIEAKVTRSFSSSMEVFIRVHGENIKTGEKYIANEAYFTFVALDETNGNPTPVPELIPETDEEKEKYNGALRRRQLRLILAGRMKADEAQELKSIFFS